MKVSTNVAGPPPQLERDTALALFRIVQEALTNAAKHSGASRVEISMNSGGGRIRLCVEDDGRGFVDHVGARRDHRGGWGLPAMRERAEAHGGELRIEFPGRGTRLIVDIPAGNAD
jgi:signal transduction histidine kinase